MKKISFTDKMPPEGELVLITDSFDGYCLRSREYGLEGEILWIDENNNLDDIAEDTTPQDWEYWSHIEFEKYGSFVSDE